MPGRLVCLMEESWVCASQSTGQGAEEVTYLVMWTCGGGGWQNSSGVQAMGKLCVARRSGPSGYRFMCVTRLFLS